jgi:hypothetical protein
MLLSDNRATVAATSVVPQQVQVVRARCSEMAGRDRFNAAPPLPPAVLRLLPLLGRGTLPSRSEFT